MHRLPGLPRHAADRLNPRTPMALPDGLYDLLLTEGLARSLAALEPGSAEVRALKGGVPERLVDVITRQLGAILDDVPATTPKGPGGNSNWSTSCWSRCGTGWPPRPAQGRRAAAKSSTWWRSPPRVLRSVRRDRQFPASPEIGLAAPWLFTAGKGSPSLLQEIRRELASADQVDILVSFITVSGVRKLQDVLQQITATGAQGQSATRLRILTTTYTGATEARALDELARLPGCEVRVSLDGRRTRLARQGLAVPAQDGLRLGLCGQRQPVGRGADRRIGVDRQADAACAGGLVCPGHRPLRDALGRQRVPTL
jgi:hypothetical protein